MTFVQGHLCLLENIPSAGEQCFFSKKQGRTSHKIIDKFLYTVKVKRDSGHFRPQKYGT